ncbi:MAG: tRNA (guanosine(46)-N7)-methyltransferase TrmB [Gammaproteobacteria bacterium]|jgi:tRNA (guanine-N7-)-methyltransferase
MLKRTIHSFVRREGRMTNAQQIAFTTLWPHYGIDITPDTVLDFNKIFNRNAPTVLEIGFGNGEALVAMAMDKPEVNFIGVEVYKSGTGALFNTLQEHNITNTRVMLTDVVPLLSSVIPAHSLTHVYIYFPDPWPKKKHRKRRLLQTEFLDLIKRVLIPGGYIHFATDWQDYAHHALKVLSEHPGFKRVEDQSQIPFYCARPSTKFYRKALQLGHKITDLSYQAV